MLSYKMDFSSCGIVPGFGKSSHICGRVDYTGGSKFHSLIMEGKNENLKQSTLVSGWVKWPLLKDGNFGIKKSS